MKLKIPPAITLLVHIGLVWTIDHYISFLGIAFPGQRVGASLLFVAGCIIALLSVFTMFRLKTTVDPVFPDKASRLITTGIFSISRNPIYLAMWLMLLSWVVWLGNPLGVVPLATFIWHLSRFQIRAEEQALTRKFGKQFEAYRKRVRRWI